MQGVSRRRDDEQAGRDKVKKNKENKGEEAKEIRRREGTVCI